MTISSKIDPGLLKNIVHLPEAEQRHVLKLLGQLEETESKEQAREGFMPFIKKVWPAFIEGRHHKIMAEAFERVMLMVILKRLIINMPPRHTKVRIRLISAPSMVSGTIRQIKKIIQTAHTAELSVGFGQKGS